MPTLDASSGARKPARSGLGAKVLDALVTGASVDEIAKAERLAPKRVEKLLRDELQRRWLAPAQDYARLQIARLEPIYAKLKSLAEEGDLRAIDNLLRVLDRLDRYHGFGKRTVSPRGYDENARQRLLAKLNQSAARLPAPPKGDA
jgi:hypothetical protein